MHSTFFSFVARYLKISWHNEATKNTKAQFKQNMNLENTQIQMRKGLLELCILNIISRGAVYATEILEELTESRMMVVEGTLYPLLTRLRKAALVEYHWVESETGPPRKYYTLTDKGDDFLDDLTATWLELQTSTKKIISNSQFKRTV